MGGLSDRRGVGLGLWSIGTGYPFLGFVESRLYRFGIGVWMDSSAFRYSYAPARRN